MVKTIFEEMGGKYERQGDYLIPCLTVPAEEEQPIGTWGQRHLDYLKQYQRKCLRMDRAAQFQKEPRKRGSFCIDNYDRELYNIEEIKRRLL